MNHHWYENINNHRVTIASIRDDLESRYNMLSNESDSYNEAMQAVIDDLEDAITDIEEALKQAKKEG